MAAPRRFELDELTVRPGTYFNPRTEVLLVVDDSPELDQAAVDLEDADGTEWVLISDEAPIDEAARDELLERFQARYHAAPRGATPLGDEELDEGDFDDEDDEDELDGVHELGAEPDED
jgi:hypothetical protein